MIEQVVVKFIFIGRKEKTEHDPHGSIKSMENVSDPRDMFIRDLESVDHLYPGLNWELVRSVIALSPSEVKAEVEKLRKKLNMD